VTRLPRLRVFDLNLDCDTKIERQSSKEAKQHPTYKKLENVPQLKNLIENLSKATSIPYAGLPTYIETPLQVTTFMFSSILSNTKEV